MNLKQGEAPQETPGKPYLGATTEERLLEKKVRKIDIHLNPLTIAVCYSTLGNILEIVRDSDTSSNADPTVQIQLDELKVLKSNLYNKPLHYWQNSVQSDILNSIEINLNSQTLYFFIYERIPVLKTPEILSIEFQNLKYFEPRLDRLQPFEKNLLFKRKEIYCEVVKVGEQVAPIVFTDGQLKQVGQKILSTSVYVLLKENIVKNSPLLTDAISTVFIPYLDLIIPSDTYHISKLIKTFSPPNKLQASKAQYLAPEDSNLAYELKGLKSELALVLKEVGFEHAELEAKNERKVCRHCILKFRKSMSIFSFTLGFQAASLQNFLAGFQSILNCEMLNKERRGVSLRLPMSFDKDDTPLTLEMPFVTFVSETGLFKENSAVFMEKIKTLTQDRFSMSMTPYWVLKNSEDLFSPSYLGNLWKEFIRYYKFYSQTDQTLLNSSEPFFPITKHGSSFSASEDPIYLIYLSKKFKNREELQVLDCMRPSDESFVFKDFVMCKIHEIVLKNNDLMAFSSLYNVRLPKVDPEQHNAEHQH